jgi:hypothetical protein
MSLSSLWQLLWHSPGENVANGMAGQDWRFSPPLVDDRIARSSRGVVRLARALLPSRRVEAHAREAPHVFQSRSTSRFAKETPWLSC